MMMRQAADQQTTSIIYQCPYCLSIDLTVRKPHCYCHDCEKTFDTDEALTFEPED
ncbi:MAG: hypothetical protein IKW89_00885 [Bacteroidales bacterium]|nr:hypothetical protein [Bacteroidales bacterium]